MVILHAPPYVKSMFVYISVNMRQFIVNSIVINCHRRGTCPKIATRSQQESTKVKKRTPPARPKNVRQKKNKPISGNPFLFSQLTARQKLRRKNPYEKRGGKISKAKPNTAIFMGNMQLRCFELASLLFPHPALCRKQL